MGKHLTESEYTAIKQLLSKGYEGKKVAEIMQRGTGTVSTVKNSASYEDYQKKIIRQLVTPKKQTELPLDKPKTNTLDIKKQDVMVKFSALFDAIITYEPAAINARPYSKRCINAAMTRLEEARLWLKETF